MNGFDRYMEQAFQQQANWQLWFAWRPVQIHNQWLWLEFLERRVPSYYDDKLRGWRPLADPPQYEYRRVA